MNSKPIPIYLNKEIIKSIIAFMGDNPEGATFERVVFAVQSDALASGCTPPSQREIGEVADHLEGYCTKRTIFHVTPPQSDDWMYQRIPCTVVQQVRQVLAEVIKVCNHTEKPTLAGVDLWELVEALRITEK